MKTKRKQRARKPAPNNQPQNKFSVYLKPDVQAVLEDAVAKTGRTRSKLMQIAIMDFLRDFAVKENAALLAAGCVLP